MVAKAAESPDRSERINQLAAAYRSGNYRADAAAVSSSIVNDAMKAG
jgi:anti-sigma28 factor (negative regulator of flagellin synthesis)